MVLEEVREVERTEMWENSFSKAAGQKEVTDELRYRGKKTVYNDLSEGGDLDISERA